MYQLLKRSTTLVIPSTLNLVTMKTSSTVVKRKLEGKVAVVTASTDGIGFAIAKDLAENGAKVVISSRKQKNVTKALTELHEGGLTDVTGIVCHVGKAEDRTKLFKTAIEKYGGLDILVSNAAVNPSVGPVVECEEEVWDKIFEINVKSSFLLLKEAAPLIKQRGGGSIVFVSSYAGFTPIQLLGAYSVSKTALLGLTKAAALDLASNNIRVNCLAPGIVETKFSEALIGNETSREIALQQIPLKKFAKTTDMGGIVTFLCSDDAAYITGETIIAAGGMQSRL